jgi:hypothetical protein
MVGAREEGREHHVLCLLRLSVYGQGWRRLTEVRLVGLMGSGFSHRVVCDCEDGWLSDQTGAQIEAWKRFRRST